MTSKYATLDRRDKEAAGMFLAVVEQRDHLKAELHAANMALSTMGRDLNVAKRQVEALYTVAVQVIDDCATCKARPADCTAAHQLARRALTDIEASGPAKAAR